MASETAVLDMAPKRLVCKLGEKRIEEGQEMSLTYLYKGERHELQAMIEKVELGNDTKSPFLVIKLVTKQEKAA